MVAAVLLFSLFYFLLLNKVYFVAANIYIFCFILCYILLNCVYWCLELYLNLDLMCELLIFSRTNIKATYCL